MAVSVGTIAFGFLTIGSLAFLWTYLSGRVSNYGSFVLLILQLTGVAALGFVILKLAEWWDWKRSDPILKQIESSSLESPESLVASLPLLETYAREYSGGERHERLNRIVDAVRAAAPQPEARTLPVAPVDREADAEPAQLPLPTYDSSHIN